MIVVEDMGNVLLTNRKIGRCYVIHYRKKSLLSEEVKNSLLLK